MTKTYVNTRGPGFVAGIPVDLDAKHYEPIPLRTQNESPELRKAISDATGWAQPKTTKVYDDKGELVTVQQDLTRQEDRDDTDMKHILARMGADDPRLRTPPQYGEEDRSVDLGTALNDVRAAREAFHRLPKDLKEQFPSWRHVLTGIASGNLTISDDQGIIFTPQPPAENAEGVDKGPPPKAA